MSEVVNPPLGMLQIHKNEENRYDQYLNDIINHHIKAFTQAWLDGEDQGFQEKLFCLLIRVNPKTEDEVGGPSQELPFADNAKL